MKMSSSMRGNITGKHQVGEVEIETQQLPVHLLPTCF